MKKVVVLGRGGAGKSTFSRHLGQATGIPVIELDSIYWGEDLQVLSAQEWSDMQVGIVAGDQWILDGDLGPYDVLEPRLQAADVVVLLDTNLAVCVARAVRRGARRRDFWQWTLSWGRVHKPTILASVQRCAPHADLVILPSSRASIRWIEGLSGHTSGDASPR